MLKVLGEDFARIPELLARTNGEPAVAPEDPVEDMPAEQQHAVQLGLF
jgi:hypothetical protein